MADLENYNGREMFPNYTLLHMNISGDLNASNWTDEYDVLGEPDAPLNWGVLALSLLIFSTALGNVLVCLAVAWEKRLQNMTNYFLMSLAIADLLVSLLVMPLAMLVELYGYFPLDPSVCVLWATMDVLMCTASIWHMCTMSMDRYFTLKYPMKYGRNKTRTMVVLKITFVWVISIAICSPICILGFMEYDNLYDNGMCIISIRDFVVYGSIFAFYIPLSIMFITYTLTIQILCTNQKLMRSIVREHSLTLNSRMRKEKNGQAGNNGTYLTPQFVPRFMDRPSVDTSVSYNASVNESCIFSTSESQREDNLDDSPSTPPKEEMPIPIVTTEATESERTSPNPNSIKLDDIEEPLSVDDELPKATDAVQKLKKKRRHRRESPIKSALSVSQPHLPSISRSRTLSSGGSQKHLLMPRARSHLSVQDLESVKNFDSLSGASSLNSMLSRENLGSGAWSDFEEPRMLKKLSQIEAEMDECLMTVEEGNDNLNDEVFEDAESRKNSVTSNESGSAANCSTASSVGKNSPASSHNSTSSSAKSSDGGSPLQSERQSQTFKFPTAETFLGNNTGKGDSNLFMPAIDGGTQNHNDSSSDESSEVNIPPSARRASSKKSSAFSFNLKRFACKQPPPSILIPPVRISQSSPTERDRKGSDESYTDSLGSDKSGFITIQLKPSGCYLYQVDCAKSSLAPAHGDTSQSSKNTSRSASPCLVPTIEATDEHMNPLDLNSRTGDVTDDPISDGGFSASTISAGVNRKYSPHAIKITSARPQGYATGWKTFQWRKKKAKMANGHIKQIISKRTASNEKKASKVLGIIFAVFCVLWTPFFIINVVSVACEACMKSLTPQMTASIVWLGYLSSLANPIIYTMFNTSFRRAFYKILTCKYKFSKTPGGRIRRPESMYLTNASGWSGSRRPTVSGSRNFPVVK